KEVILPVKFKTLTPEPLGKNQPTTVRNVNKELEKETEDEKTDSEEEYEEEELEDQIYGYGEIADIETFTPLSLFPPTPSILDTPIDMPCTLLELLLLPLTPKNKTNYSLIDLSIPYSYNSSDSSSFSLSAPLDSPCPNELPSLIPLQIEGCQNKEIWYLFLDLGALKIGEKKCYVDESGNTYLQESNAQPDPHRYITISSKTESLPVSDLFDYFYEERQDPYQLGKLEPQQHLHIQQFIGNNLDIFIWEKGSLG
ncbi:22333_t:CDS:2, partial [Gigaspora rosea]